MELLMKGSFNMAFLDREKPKNSITKVKCATTSVKVGVRVQTL